MAAIRNEYFPLKKESDQLIRLGFEVHNRLGAGFLEIVYKDAYEYELASGQISFEREKVYEVRYKDIILAHKFFADFIVMNSIILEIKAKQEIADEDMAQTINYLRCSGCKVGLILNFGCSKLEIRRVVF